MKRCFWLWALLLLALTGFSQQYSTGLLFDEEVYALQPVSAKLTRSTYTNIPARYSLKDYCPTPKSQGRTGTCTAWATAFNARTISESVRLDRTDKAAIDANTFSPSFVYNQIRLRSGCDQGTYIHHALDLMMADGVSKFSQYGFDCYREIGSTELGHASQYKIYDYKRLFSSYESDKIQPIKIALANKRPVVFGMRCPDSFHGAGDVWEVEDVEYTNPHSGGHAMAVIGYDDSKYNGAFLVENSWGTNWGNGGYTWIKYPDFNKFTFCAYEIIEEPPVQVDLIGSISFNDFNRRAFDIKFNSSSGEYETEDSYASGSFFRFYVTNENPAWLYAISTDHTGEIYEIFPHADTVSAFVSANNSTLAFPDEEHFIKMDEKTGTDVFCIIYSKRKLDYKAFVAEMNSRSGSLKERVLAYFGDAVIESTSVEYDLEEIAFAAKSGVHTVLPIFINIKHH